MYKSYLILAHQNPSQLHRLINRLNDTCSHFYIHIDLKCNIKEYKKGLELTNVSFIKNRIKCAWGDISLIQATINCIKQVLQDKRKGYCILISGQDYPLQSNEAFNKFLDENSAYDFVELKPIATLWKYKRKRSSLNYYKFDLSDKRNDLVLIPSIFCSEFYSLYTLSNIWKVIIHGKGNLFLLFKERKFPPYLKPYGGSQWWALRTQTVEKMIIFLNNRKGYLKYHLHSFCADEFLFHSILNYFHSSKQIQIKDNLTFVNWQTTNRTSPEILTSSDLQLLKQHPSHHFFARKFDISKDATILDQLDNHIDRHLQKSPFNDR